MAKQTSRVETTTPVRTLFMRRGTASVVHRHDEPAMWLHVVSGEVVEERWKSDAFGAFVCEKRRLRRGQSIAAPADGLHRITAIEDAALVATCFCDCMHSQPAAAADLDRVSALSQCAHENEWASSTVLGLQAP